MTKLKNYLVSIAVPITATSPEVAAEMAEENLEDMLSNDVYMTYSVKEVETGKENIVGTDGCGDFVIKEVF